MSHARGHFIAVVVCLLSLAIALADISVSVNVNKPVFDVNEQFVSFSIPPELLFHSLDGPNKKTLSLMAAMVGPSYMKLTGDYFFPSDMKSTLKNPTQAIWRGFNRWTGAMNWTMVIPVHYTPLSWDPIDALRILNISNTVGIDNCVWQLGLDFGASRAADYVADLNTLDTMVDTFRPYVKSWTVIGADITAGSSAEETKRYIDMSKDVNTAFGWTQPAGYHIEENVNGYIYEKDLSLKAMMEKKVPVWLSVPPNGPINQVTNGYANTEVSEALRWARTLGDAASSGFDAVFKPITAEDVCEPNYSFFVTALFKKIMGNRVFTPKPVKSLSFASKLYTHCANGISGGIAFMSVNTEDSPVKISAKLSAKYTGSEVWQFILTSKRGAIYLNNEELALNSTLDPFVKIKHPNKPLAINMPPMSVGFWVLPLANHEECQFTELLSSYKQENQWENRQRKQTSTDRLLKKLILETSFTDQMKNRRRRDTSFNYLNKGSSFAKGNLITRRRRFILQETPSSDVSLNKVALASPRHQERNLKKRENANNWFRTMLMKPVARVIPGFDWGLKRTRREANPFLRRENPTPRGSIRPQKAPRTKHRNTNEADIFKKHANYAEMYLPVGDVHLRYIQGPDGEEINTKASREELEEERAPRRALSVIEVPPQFYESIPHERYQPKANVHATRPKSANDEISTIRGHTNFLGKHFDVVEVEQEKAYTPPVQPDEQGKPKSAPGIEFTMQRYPHPPPNEAARFDEYDLDESESLQSWAAERRAKRALLHGDAEPLQDNLITNDENVQLLSHTNLEMGASTPDVSTIYTEGKGAAGEEGTISKIFNAFKSHLSSFFSSLVR